MSKNVIVSLASRRATPADDIPATLRQIADDIETGKVENMDIVTTCVVILGHTRDETDRDGTTLHWFDRELFACGPRRDAFTVAGLMSMALAKHNDP